MKTSTLTWYPPTKIPKVTEGEHTIVCRTVRGITPSFKVPIQHSVDILIRVKHGKTNYRLGDDGWKNYPDPQAGRYKYYIGKYSYSVEEDGKLAAGSFEVNGYETGLDEWAYLPNCVDAGYTW